MKRVMIALLASSAAVCAAQAQPQTQYGPDNGFFRPAPDVALTGPKANGSSGSSQQQPFLTLQSPGMPVAAVPVPAVVTPVPVAAMPAATSAPVATMPAATSVPVAAVPASTTTSGAAQQPAQAPALSGPELTQATQAWAERQMDRSVLESERERTRAQSTPAGVGAAFDGTTSSENR